MVRGFRAYDNDTHSVSMWVRPVWFGSSSIASQLLARGYADHTV